MYLCLRSIPQETHMFKAAEVAIDGFGLSIVEMCPCAWVIFHEYAFVESFLTPLMMFFIC